MAIENIDRPFGRITPLRITTLGLERLFTRLRGVPGKISETLDRIIRTDQFNDDTPGSPHKPTLGRKE